MKKTLLLIAALYGLIACAADAPAPVAVWNGDFSATEKGNYTLSANGNTVAADGSSITISAAKGVTFERSSALANTVGMTVIYKFDNLVVGSTVKTIATASAGGGNADRVGVNVQTSGQTSGIWANTGTYNTSATQTTVPSITTEGQFVLVYGPSVSNNTGTYLYLKNGSADYMLAYSCGGLKGGDDTVQAMTVGGTRNNGGTFPAATGMVIKAVALFDQALTKDQIAAYEFPQKESSATPVLLINIGTTIAVDGWLAHNQTGGEWIPTQTTKLSQGDVTFQVSKSTFGGNFSSAEGFGSPVTTTFESGSYSDVFGKRHDSIFDEIKTSLGLSADITESIYTTGVINGGQNSHIGTIGGLDASAKYIVYVGQGYKKKDGNDTHSFKIDTDGYAAVESLDYAVTVDGNGTTKNAQYTSFDAGATLQPGINGLLVVRMKGVVPKDDGTIVFTMPSGRSGLNFLAVAKVNETISYTTAEIEGGSETSVTAFNALLADTNNKAEVTLSDGAVVSYDATPTVPTKLICEGSITLSATEKPSDLTKLDLSGVTGGVIRTWLTDDEKKGIGFNFASKRGPITTGALEEGSVWYNNNDGGSNDEGKNGTDIAMSSDGLTTITWSSANTYDDDASTHGNNSSASMVRGYLDDANGVSITVKNIPFAEYAVIIYASTDDPNNPKLTHKVVNDVNYTYDSTCSDVAKEGTDAWGQGRSSSTVAYGTNAIRVIEQTKGTLTITSPKNTSIKARGCISAIQIVPYSTLVAPSIDEGFTLEANETTVEDFTSGTVTLDISGVKENDYSITYTAVVNGLETPITGAVDKEHGLVSFNLDSLVPGTVYRGTITLTYDDGKVLETTSFAVHAGEQQFVWTTEGELWVNETATTKDSTGTWTEGISVNSDKLVVNTASGVTFTPTANPDYVEKCDSTFTVSISASEAVDAASDPKPAADVQGGVRIASEDGVLKVQALADGVWADLKSSGVDTDKGYEVVVAFHYAKDGVKDDADSVSYTLDGVTVTGGKVANTVAKISSVEVADGTSLAFLKGVCQLDKAVIVDVVIDHSDEKTIEADDLAAAQKIADKMVIAISEEVAKVVSAETYRGYFKVVAKEGSDGKFHAIVEFLPGVQDAIEDDIEKSMETVVAGFETGSAEIAAKPGLYYGVKRGETLEAMSVKEDLQMAGADGKVTITITKPEGAAAHFYRIICSPTPNH